MLDNDHWTLDIDQLGMGATGDQLTELILQCQPPYAVCVQGKWGSGKTSLMRYAMASLGGEPLAMTLKTSSQPRNELPLPLQNAWTQRASDSRIRLEEVLLRDVRGAKRKEEARKRLQVICIWFNPWQHQGSDMPLVALLREVRAQFSALLKAKTWATKISQVSVEAGLNILGELVDALAILQGAPKPGFGSVVPAIRERGEAYERRNFEVWDNAQRLNLLFEQAVERLLRPSAQDEVVGDDGYAQVRRLVIFVDDLDRCSDEQTVRLLEAIKLYLQTRYCVFVIGMDVAAARRSVQRILPHTGSEEAQEYLEKLFQARVAVQIPERHDDFVLKLLRRAGLTERSTRIAPQEIAKYVTALVEPNPRKLKNFVSGLAVGWNILCAKEMPPISFASYLLTSYLRNYHPEIHRLVSHEPSLLGDLQVVLNEGAAQLPAGTSPVQLFFHRSFRHTFELTPSAGSEDTMRQIVSRKEADEVVDELISRLDRYRGDRAFRRLWQEMFDEKTEGDVVEALKRGLLVSCPLSTVVVDPEAGADEQ